MKHYILLIFFLFSSISFSQNDWFKPSGGTASWLVSGTTISPLSPWDSTRFKLVLGTWGNMSYIQPYGVVGTQPDSAYGIKFWKSGGTKPIMNLNAHTVIVGGDKTANFTLTDAQAVALGAYGGLVIRGQVPSAGNEGPTVSLLSSYLWGTIQFYQTGPAGQGNWSKIVSGALSSSGYRAGLNITNYQRTVRLQENGIGLGRMYDLGSTSTEATIRGGNVDVKGTLYADTIITPLRVIDTTDVQYGDSLAYRVVELRLPWSSRTIGINTQQRRGRMVFEVNITGNYTSNGTGSGVEYFDLISDTANGVYMSFIKTITRGGYSSGPYYGGEHVAWIQRWSSGDLDWVTLGANYGTYVDAYNGAIRSAPDLVGRVPEGYAPLIYYSTNSGGSAIVTIEVEFYVAEAAQSAAIGDSDSSWWIKLVNI